MRVFLAIEVDEGILGKILEIQKEFAKCDAQVKYVETENLHCTLKFFGEIDEKKLEDIINIIENNIKDHKPFKMSIRKIGVFPNEKYVRVLWLGMEDIDPFVDLQKKLDNNFKKLGFKKERSYTPHLTIGRVKGSRNKEELLDMLQKMSEVEIGQMDIDKIVLKKSELTPAGPIYTIIKEFNLKT